jgi:hypothetical protein
VRRLAPGNDANGIDRASDLLIGVDRPLRLHGETGPATIPGVPATLQTRGLAPLARVLRSTIARYSFTAPVMADT